MPSATRRTTLTLPDEALHHAERIARARHVNLSTVVAEALSEGLKLQAQAERARQILGAYRKAFTGFSAEELLLLDGVVLDRARPRGKRG